jgi:hypothetical protein
VCSEYVAESSSVQKFVRTYCATGVEYDLFLEYIRAEVKMITCHVIVDNVTLTRWHRLLFLLSIIPPKAATLSLLALFMRTRVLTVHIAVERYLLHTLNDFRLSTSNDELDDRALKQFIRTHHSFFRLSFLVRIFSERFSR